nr:MAG TPA: TRAF PROTEIN, TRAO PROTEIN, TRAN ADHESION, BACTERIAL SECRETION.5A [Caudoviricetes sp.]
MRKTTLILTAFLLAGCDDGMIQKQTWAYAELCISGVIYLRSPNGSLTQKLTQIFILILAKKE